MKFSDRKRREPSLSATGLAIGLVLEFLGQVLGIIIVLAALAFSFMKKSVAPFVGALFFIYIYGKAMDRFVPWVLKHFEKDEESKAQ